MGTYFYIWTILFILSLEAAIDSSYLCVKTENVQFHL
jgi:hypothetical protein